MGNTFGTGNWTIDQLKSAAKTAIDGGTTAAQIADWSAANKVPVSALAQVFNYKDSDALISDVTSKGLSYDKIAAINQATANAVTPQAPKISVQDILTQLGQLKPPSVSTWTPTTRNVDYNTETIEGRLPGLINGPIAQQAGAQARAGMNSRGLLNSSMTDTAVQDAMLRSAVPIAAQDAGTYSSTAAANQAAKNAAGQFNAGSKNESSMQGFRGQQESLLQALRGAQQTELAGIEAQFKNQMQASASAANYYTNLSSMINETLNSPNMTVDQKQQVVSKQLDLLKMFLPLLGKFSGVDLSQYLQF
jgi:hypothetical protein